MATVRSASERSGLMSKFSTLGLGQPLELTLAWRVAGVFGQRSDRSLTPSRSSSCEEMRREALLSVSSSQPRIWPKDTRQKRELPTSWTWLAGAVSRAIVRGAPSGREAAMEEVEVGAGRRGGGAAGGT